MEKRFLVFDGHERDHFGTGDSVVLKLFESQTGRRCKILFTVDDMEHNAHSTIYHGTTTLDGHAYTAVTTLHTKDRHADSVVLTPVPSTR